MHKLKTLRKRFILQKIAFCTFLLLPTEVLQCAPSTPTDTVETDFQGESGMLSLLLTPFFASWKSDKSHSQLSLGALAFLVAYGFEKLTDGEPQGRATNFFARHGQYVQLAFLRNILFLPLHRDQAGNIPLEPLIKNLSIPQWGALHDALSTWLIGVGSMFFASRGNFKQFFLRETVAAFFTIASGRFFFNPDHMDEEARFKRLVSIEGPGITRKKMVELSQINHIPQLVGIELNIFLDLVNKDLEIVANTHKNAVILTVNEMKKKHQNDKRNLQKQITTLTSTITGLQNTDSQQRVERIKYNAEQEYGVLLAKYKKLSDRIRKAFGTSDTFEESGRVFYNVGAGLFDGVKSGIRLVGEFLPEPINHTYTCSICLSSEEGIQGRILTFCGSDQHGFHGGCLKRWYALQDRKDATQKQCPICRGRLNLTKGPII